jgi:prenyltransferase beta subunit
MDGARKFYPMSMALEMLQAARRSPELLGSSSELVVQLFLRQQAASGGFVDRAGQSDLYYTVFAMAGLGALKGHGSPGGFSAFSLARRLSKWLGTFNAESLDLVHLCSLIRCRAMLSKVGLGGKGGRSEEDATLLERFRAADGGYSAVRGAEAGSAYGAFLACGAHQDLGLGVPDPERLKQSLLALQDVEGGWSNFRPGQPMAISSAGTNATAAALVVLRELNTAAPPKAIEWLLARAHSGGGFVAAPGVRVPDLLSTATALHSLALSGVSLASMRDKCLDFIDTLWTKEGGFYGHWGDTHLDCEYTFYGLLALGRLAA